MRTLLGCVMILNAALFFFGALQHVGIVIGRFHEPRIIPAAIVETVCGLSLACGVIAVYGQSAVLWRTALISNVVAVAVFCWEWLRWLPGEARVPPVTTCTLTSC